MREAIKVTGFDFVPYFEDEYWDILVGDGAGHMETVLLFPPSANLPSNRSPDTVSIRDVGDFPKSEEEKELMNEFYNIIHTSQNEKRFASWIQKHQSLGIKFDTSRLARYALYYDKLQIVKYLVHEEGADLQQEDTLGRSAIFYAMSEPKSFQTWKYISQYVSGVKNLLDQVDTLSHGTKC